MGLFKDFKDDFSQAVNEMMPGADAPEKENKAEDLVVNTLGEDVDVKSELSKLDGLLEQVQKDGGSDTQKLESELPPIHKEDKKPVITPAVDPVINTFNEEKKIMKKRIAGILTAALIGTTVMGTVVMAAPSGAIDVISREDGSGTRGAFVELFGIEEKQGDEKVDMTTEEASITNNTDVMLTTVAGDENSIGYVSLGSLNDTVKAVKIDGAEATAENVADDTYKVARPFNIVTGDKLSDAAQDFINYIMSSDGQDIIEKEGYIKVDEKAEAYKAGDAKGKVVVMGSSSVGPVMEKLAEAYQKTNKNITVEVQVSDSTTGINSATEGVCDIGMASRELKDEETEKGVKATEIAKDGIAVIVNNDNDLEELSSDQVKSIFTGDITDWEDVTK